MKLNPHYKQLFYFVIAVLAIKKAFYGSNTKHPHWSYDMTLMEQPVSKIFNKQEY